MTSVGVGTFLFVKKILSDFSLLQARWASCMLFRSLGCPPLSIGMMWSMQGDNGCGYLYLNSPFSFSTGRPQIPQISWVAKILRLFASNTPRWDPSLSGRYLAIIHLTKKAPSSDALPRYHFIIDLYLNFQMLALFEEFYQDSIDFFVHIRGIVVVMLCGFLNRLVVDVCVSDQRLFFLWHH